MMCSGATGDGFTNMLASRLVPESRVVRAPLLEPPMSVQSCIRMHDSIMARNVRLPFQALRQLSPSAVSYTHLKNGNGYVFLNSTTYLPCPPSQTQPCRDFSTSQRCCAGAVMKAMKPQGKRASQPSMAVTHKAQKDRALREGQMPDDLGLLPDTFILPQKATERWSSKLRKKWLRMRFWEIVGAVSYRLFFVKPRPKLQLGRIPEVAKRLHTQMYEHFATGNLEPVEKHLCAGLLGSLRHRVSLRPQGQTLRWKLVKYLSQPRLVSYKSAMLPGQTGDTAYERNGIVQAVVRIHSMQALQRVQRSQARENGRLVIREEALDGDKERPKETVEYVVVQKMLRRGKEGDWMLWGFAEATTLDKIEKEERQQGAGQKALKANV